MNENSFIGNSAVIIYRVCERRKNEMQTKKRSPFDVAKCQFDGTPCFNQQMTDSDVPFM